MQTTLQTHNFNMKVEMGKLEKVSNDLLVIILREKPQNNYN